LLINAALATQDIQAIMEALRSAVRHHGVESLANKGGVHSSRVWRAFYMKSIDFRTVEILLRGMGLRLMVQPLEPLAPFEPAVRQIED
jgi:DNA-binding phage protein